jgi:hypothetical protein
VKPPTFYCDCDNPKPRAAGVRRAVCVECHGEVRVQKKDETDAESATMQPPRKSSRAMTEIERQEWRDLNRRVKLYEETFGVRYSRERD